VEKGKRWAGRVPLDFDSADIFFLRPHAASLHYDAEHVHQARPAIKALLLFDVDLLHTILFLSLQKRKQKCRMGLG
jgi:hypothetical protein